MYLNNYIGVQNLRKAATIEPGGYCRIALFKIEDVATWPAIDPVNGVINDPVLLKPGGVLYVIEATEKDKTFTEASKSGPAGDFMDIEVITNLAGNTLTNALGITAMMHHEFGMIIWDRDGYQRLIGNQDAGATLIHKYTSGDSQSSRYRTLQWKYQHPLPAPFYLAGTIIPDGLSSFFTALTFITRFRVGAPGSPMDDGDTAYTNILLANKNFLMLADGKAIHQMSDNPDQRYCSKTFASDTIIVHGGVSEATEGLGEVIEIYTL